MRNPTIIPDYSAIGPRSHKKFDYRFTSLPGDDQAPMRCASDMFPAGVVRAHDTFDRKQASASKSSHVTGSVAAPKEPEAPTKASRRRAPGAAHCIIS